MFNAMEPGTIVKSVKETMILLGGMKVIEYDENNIPTSTLRQTVYPCLSPNDIPVVPTTVAAV